MEKKTYTGKIQNIIAILFKMAFEFDPNKVYDLIIQEHPTLRSLQQNKLLWELCSKIGEKTTMAKEDVYINMLKSYGQSDVFTIKKNVRLSHYFKYYEVMEKGQYFNDVIVYRGSSTYTKEEMKLLLDGIKQECDNYDIVTYSREELRLILDKWYG